MGATLWSGNTVSTFSALLLLQRQHSGQLSTWYNGGGIPLEHFIPLYTVPWVFVWKGM
jgi:hypothetical protein